MADAIRPYLSRADIDELVAVRSMLCHEISRRALHGDSKTVQLQSLRSRIRHSLDEADLRKRAAGMGALRTITDYREFKPTWGSSVHEIYKLYDGFAAAMTDAELTFEPSPRRGLTVKDGARTTGRSHTYQSCLRDLAAMFEHNRGRMFGNDDYDLFARAGGGMASSDRVLKVAERERGWKGKGTFQRVCFDAFEAVVNHWPVEFPITTAYSKLLQAAAISES
jgi:hypothetical protein